MKSIIKLTTPWSHDLLKRTPGNTGVFGDFKFEIDNECSVCDYWIVWGGLKEKMRVNCPKDNVIYLTDEIHEKRIFNRDFLDQFSALLTDRNDLAHSKVIQTHDLGIWHFNKSYDEVRTGHYDKTENISVVSSDLTWLEGHKKRFAFTHQLMGHFKDRMHFYGRGINTIADKFDGIAPYRYSIAIENNFQAGYFTEKLFECFLTDTFPIYYGCPDLELYFDASSYVRIDINDYRGAIEIIEKVLSDDRYEKSLPYVREAKRRYLEKYFLFPALISLIKVNFASSIKKGKWNVLYPENNFSISRLRKFYNKIS